MLGLGQGTSITKKRSTFLPIDVDSCVAWYDFRDLTTMYTDTGSTNISSDGQGVYRIDNKSYTYNNLNNNINIGKYLEQASASNRPTYRTGGGGYVSFDGSNDILIATNTSGNVDTNKLSDTTLNGRALTIFFITEASAALVSGDEYLMHLSGAESDDRMSIYVDNNLSEDRWQWHDQNNVARTNVTINCGQNLTTSKELWTVDLDGASSGSFYRNNNTADGITNGSTDNHNIDLSANDADVKFMLGGDGSSNNFAGGIYEFIIYDRALIDKEIRMVNKYLLTKHKM